MIVIAHNIRSLHNVGSVFRSADAFGVEKLYLSGYTGTPPRREIAKTALGAEDRVPWERAEDVFALVRELRGKGWRVLGLETGPSAAPLNGVRPDARVALVLGNEVEGIDEPLRRELDGLVEIPMSGQKRSLNVSVAAGIAMFHFQAKL